MIKVRIHELAAKEFDQAIGWYDLQLAGLGNRFRKSVLNQIKKIKKNPDWFLIEDDAIYKAYIPKFPYKVLFTFSENEVIIWSIAHMHREPWFWQSRIKK